MVTTPTSVGRVYQRSEQVPKTETTYTDDELGLAEGWDEQLDPNIKEMRRHAKVTERENKDLRAQLALRTRLDSFQAAGVPNDAKGKAFAKLYEGSDDPAEVQASYEELFGPTQAATGESAGASTDADQRIAAATGAGTSQGTPGTVDLADAIRNAPTVKDALAIIAAAPPEAHIQLPPRG